MKSQRREELEQARREIAHGRQDDAEMLVVDWIARHSCDPIARDLLAAVNQKLENQE